MDALQTSLSIQDRHAFRRLVVAATHELRPQAMVKLVTDRRTNLSHSEGIRETTRTLLRSTLYNPAMNKRARKRLKEAIEKKNLERQKMLKEQSSASSQTKERRGFTVKPEKKRG
jgi:hypothetical protein